MAKSRIETPSIPFERGKIRVVLYTRVSKGDTQTTENQATELRRFAATQEHWILIYEYADNLTGSGEKERPAFNQMIAAAAARRFDLILFWSLDRFSREGTAKTLQHLHKLDADGVHYRSLKEPFIDTIGPFKDAVIAIMAALAQQERNRIRERVSAGISRARDNGQTLGRPRHIVDASKLAAMAKTHSLSQIAAQLKVSKATISRRISAYRRQHPEII